MSIILLKVWPHSSRAVFVGIIRVDLVTDLSAGLSTTELTTKLEARVPINADLSPIDGLKVEAVQGILSLLSGSIFYETETTRSLLDFVKTHDQVDHLSTLPEKLEKLTLISVEAEVTHVEGR
jgi:hypothetical protein